MSYETTDFGTFPYSNPADVSPLYLRATLDEARAKGWELDDSDYAAAIDVATAERARWEASQRPLGAMVARRVLE